ncbi:MAG TPA: pilus assembly protein TadG-related protein [Acidimicrobiia bacterium]
MTERGAVSILVISVLAALIVLGLAVTGAGLVIDARAHAVNAADAAALAAAVASFPPLGSGAAPNSAARAMAVANGARLVECRCPVVPDWVPRSVTVRVGVEVSLPLVGRRTVFATSEAEFDPTAALVIR